MIMDDDLTKKNQEHYELGCKFYDDSKFQKATLFFKKSLEYWPEDAQAWMALGNCYDALRKFKRAERAFEKALEYSQENDKESVMFNLANSLFDQEKYSEAIVLYEKIVSGSELWRKAQRNICLSKESLNLTNKVRGCSKAAPLL